MNISVLGSGRWGSFIAWYCNKIGHDVYLFGRKNSKNFCSLQNDRKNEYLELPKTIQLNSSLQESLSHGEIIIISISAQELRNFSKEISKYPYQNKKFVLCMKGLEGGTGKRLSQVIIEELQEIRSVSIWVGPGHVQDFTSGIPNCMILDSENIEITKEIVRNLSSDFIRFYYGRDLIGNEIGSAAKNVIGIAAGMLDGLGLSSLKGALMARGAREISRLIKALGGLEITAYGLSHLGDYDATLFSPHSQNRRFGELFVKNEHYDKLAEGASTVKALMVLSQQKHVELPICESVHKIVNDGNDPKEVLFNLFLRPLKSEF
jgi:glycerol-3-phosphate dehydrogenase (NAD(P)+)